MAIVARLYDAGLRELMLAGSLGFEDPPTVRARFARILDRHPGMTLCYHVHDQAGLASANVLAARQNAELAGAIAGRCLLSLARKGLALRLDR